MPLRHLFRPSFAVKRRPSWYIQASKSAAGSISGDCGAPVAFSDRSCDPWAQIPAGLFWLGNDATRLSPGLLSVDPEFAFLHAIDPTRPASDRKATVLVVEDDRTIRYLFTHVLIGNGFEVIACEDGASGLAMAKARINDIHALVTDSRMPGLDGRELIAQIRALRPTLPILVVSGNIDENAARNADPATLYLAKPLSPDRLTVELRRLLCGTM
jgi:CheY-like chemotaxis protein